MSPLTSAAAIRPIVVQSANVGLATAMLLLGWVASDVYHHASGDGPSGLVQAGPVEVFETDDEPEQGPAAAAYTAITAPEETSTAPGAAALSDTYAAPTVTGFFQGEARATDCYIAVDERSRATAGSGLRGTPREFIEGMKTVLRRPCANLRASIEQEACVFKSDRTDYGFAAYAGLSPCE